MHSHDSDDGARIDAPSKRTYSIDLALELERQLGGEFPAPSTPADALAPKDTNVRPQSLDPHILANLVMQLRHSVAEITRERDDLQHLLSHAMSKSAEYKDNLQYMTEKCSTMEVQLEQAKKKMKDDEDAITMLRSKVEESRSVLPTRQCRVLPLTLIRRRAVMRLQADTRENRRMSLGQGLAPLDPSRPGFSLAPPSSKRTSLSPLYGTLSRSPNSHKRASSISDPGSATPMSPAFTLPESPAPSPALPSRPLRNSRRYSSFLGQITSPTDRQVPDATAGAVAALHREVETLKAELEETRHDLAESKDAREASETCVVALRQFISENNVGGSSPTSQDSGTLKLPPMPTMTHGDEPDTSNIRTNGSSPGWSFKLWKGDNVTVKPTVPAANTANHPPSTTTEPLTRKLGGFFTSRANVSPAPPTVPQSRSALPRQRDQMHNGSDTSSMAESVEEPVSPTASDQPAAPAIAVRAFSGSSDSSGIADRPKNIHVDTVDVKDGITR
jgi:hypothetical protein